MSMKSKNFSLDYVFPYFLYDYVEDKREAVRVVILVIYSASSMYHPKIVENDLSLQIR